jgi:hypothetical protein
MCRELHEPFLVRIAALRNKKASRIMLFSFHPLPTGLSTVSPLLRVFSAAFLRGRGGLGVGIRTALPPLCGLIASNEVDASAVSAN